MKKKILSLLLALMVLFSMAPAAVFAADVTESDVSDEEVYELAVTEEADEVSEEYISLEETGEVSEEYVSLEEASMDKVTAGDVNYYYVNTAGKADDTEYTFSVTTGRGANAVTTDYSYKKAELTQLGDTDWYYIVQPGATALTGTLYGYGNGTATTYKEVYKNLGIETSAEYDAISSATAYTGHHAKDIPSLVTYGVDAAGNKAITGLNLSRTVKVLDATTYVEANILNASGAELTDAQKELLATTLKVNPMKAPADSVIPVKLSSISYQDSKYGVSEFAIVPDDTVEGYVWSEYWGSVYAATVSNGTETVGAVHWIDLYGEAATSGKHYNTVELAFNNGTSVATNQAEVSRYAVFFDPETGKLKDGTYTVTIYAEGYEDLTATYTIESDKYIQMNVPYTDFYAAYDLTDKAVWEVEEGVDAVSTATTSKFLGTTGLAKGTYNDGKYILGVTIPVKVSSDDYKLLATDLTENNDYYFTDLEAAPDYYAELSITDGKYSFSKTQDTTYSTDNLTVDDLEISGSYGDYQITLTGFSTGTDGITISDKEDENLKDYVIYGAILNMNDGSYGVTCLENLWYGNRVPNVEIAWSIPEGKQLKRGHGSGGNFYQFANTNGAELKSVDVITNYGIFHLTKGTAIGNLTEYFAGDLSKLTYSLENGSKELTISGIPSELQDVKVSVAANGDTLVSEGSVTDGKVALGKAPTAGTTYTLTISSSNYPDITRTLATSIVSEQKEDLQKWIDKAKAVEGYDQDKDLQEHVAEAEDMLKDDTKTSADAAELIGELKEKTKKYFPTATLSAELTETTLKLNFDVDLKTLENPEYTLSIAAGRKTQTFSSGSITDLQVTLPKNAVEGTEYTLTVTSDNYTIPSIPVTCVKAVEEAPVEPEQPGKQASTIVVKPKSVTYNGKVVASNKATVTGSKGKITYTYYSDKAATKKIAASKVKNAGTYYVKASVAADENFEAATSAVAKITIKQAANPLTLKAKKVTKTIKARKTKKKAQNLSLIKFKKKGQGTVTYTKASGSKQLTVNKKTGKITVKKGTRKGTYKIVVNVFAKGNANYKKSATKKITITVKVK